MSLLLLFPRYWGSSETPPVEPPKSGPIFDVGGGAASAGKRYDANLKTLEELKGNLKAELAANWEELAGRSNALAKQIGTRVDWQKASAELAADLDAAKMLDAVMLAEAQSNLQKVAELMSAEADDAALILLIASLN